MEHKELLAILAGRLRELRTARGWTQTDVATRARVSRDFIGKAERGEREPSLYVLHKLAATFGVEPAHLITKEVDTDDHAIAAIARRIGPITKEEFEWLVSVAGTLLENPPPGRARSSSLPNRLKRPRAASGGTRGHRPR